MGAIAETDLLQWRAVYSEFERGFERIFIAIARGKQEHNPVPGPDALAPHLAVASCPAHELVDRRSPTNRFLHQARNKRGIGPYASELRWMFAERPDRAGNRGRRRV